jgi:hypothetical protein
MAVLNGKRNETLSAAAWATERDKKFFGFWRPVIDSIFRRLGHSDHCLCCWLEEQATKAETP